MRWQGYKKALHSFRTAVSLKECMEPDRAVKFIQGHQGRGFCDTHRVETQCVSERCFEKGDPLPPPIRTSCSLTVRIPGTQISLSISMECRAFVKFTQRR